MSLSRMALRTTWSISLIGLGMVHSGLASAQSLTVDPVVKSMVDQVDTATLTDDVAGLTGVHPIQIEGAPYTVASRNTWSVVPIQKVTQYLYEFLQVQGIPASFQPWSQRVSSRNVVGEKKGLTRPDEVVLLVAHLDDLPNGDVAPGADDNASGVAALMSAARILAPYGFERTLRFAFVTGEEQGKFGSQYYAQAARAAGENLVAVYNLDVVGWDADGVPVVRVHTRASNDEDNQIADLFASASGAYVGDGLLPRIEHDDFSQSDHTSFWDARYPAVLIAEDHIGEPNHLYHTKGDTIDTLNFPYLARVTRALVAATAHNAQRWMQPFFLAADKASSDACTAGTATFDVAVRGDGLSSTTVGLTVRGAPVGSTADITPSSVVTGGHATVSVRLYGAEAGDYPLTITGSSGSATHEVSVTLRVVAGVPAQPSLLTPATDAVLSSRTPSFGWTGGAQPGTTYRVEVATDPAFTQLVYQAIESSSTHIPDGVLGLGHSGAGLLAPDTQHYWRVRASNACGTGANSEARGFWTAPKPVVLLVDDDSCTYDVRRSYTDALDGLGVGYDVWDTSCSDVEPDAALLGGYPAVLWYSGNQLGAPAGPGTAGEAALASYLDSAGRFMFVSSGYFARPQTAFPSQYLNVLGSDGQYVQYLDVTGTGPLAQGSYTLSYSTKDGQPWYGMHFRPDGAQSVLYDAGFLNTSGIRVVGPGAVTKETDRYKTSYWGFPFEALPTPEARRETLRSVLDWMVPPGIRGDVDSNGVVNIVDALMVARHTTGLTPRPFDRRVADANCDGSIDITDALLLARYSAGLVAALCP